VYLKALSDTDPNDPRPETESIRQEAASVLLTALDDYHLAKRLIQKKKITLETFKTLRGWERKIVRNGKLAWEWFKNKPMPNHHGWTLDGCCAVLRWEPEVIREQYARPSCWRKYRENQAKEMSLYGVGGQIGEDHHKAKLGELDVLAIRAAYSTGLYTQTYLAKQYGVGQAQIQSITSRKTWRHL
jgi:hypothetical protein